MAGVERGNRRGVARSLGTIMAHLASGAPGTSNRTARTVAPPSVAAMAPRAPARPASSLPTSSVAVPPSRTRGSISSSATAGGASARDVTPSADSRRSPRAATSARTRTTSASTPSRWTASLRKDAPRAFGSMRTTRRPRQASVSPGRPAPDPTSMIVPVSGNQRVRAAPSSRCRGIRRGISSGPSRPTGRASFSRRAANSANLVAASAGAWIPRASSPALRDVSRVTIRCNNP